MKVSTQRKKKTYDYLQKKGHWCEASAWKEAMRIGPPKLTGGEAWTRMEEKFLPQEFLDELDAADFEIEPFEPPEPNFPPPTNELTPAELEHLKKVSGGEVDLRADLEWAYSNHLNQDLSAVDAPTPGAWSLVVFAKMNPTKFMELAIKLLSTKKTTESEDRWNDKCPEVLDLVEKLLDEERQEREERKKVIIAASRYGPEVLEMAKELLDEERQKRHNRTPQSDVSSI